MMAPVAAVTNPYPGLRPFEIEQSDLFFGRETQTDELLRRLGRSRLLAVVGTSGSGKSSLVRAGLLPALMGGFLTAAGSHWRIAVLRPGGDPIDSLASVLHVTLYPDATAGEDKFGRDMLEVTLRRSSLGLVEATRQARLQPQENLLVVVDQFEELFRFRKMGTPSGSADQAASFVRLLLEATRQSDVSIHVLITMRSDFLGDCAQFRDLSEAINDGLYLIPRMSRDQLRLAITAPAAVDGVSMTPRLIQELLNSVSDDPDQLPVLQHALMRMWTHWQNTSDKSRAVDLDDYLAVGGMAEALSRHANETWEGLSEGPRLPHRQLAKRLFQCLTEKGRDNREIRRPTRLRDLCHILAADQDSLRAVIDCFRADGRAFLMPPLPTSLDESSVIDISHESLIRKWVRLRGWVEQEAQSAAMYQRLAKEAGLEQRGAASLWGNPQLQMAVDWRSNTPPTEAWAEQYDPNFKLAMSFLDRSIQEYEAEVRRERAAREREAKARQAEKTRKKVYGLLIATIIIAGVFGGLYIDNRRLLRENIARRLATQAALVNSQTDAAVAQSVLLAAESLRRLPSLQSEEVLRAGLALLPREITRLVHQKEVKAVAFSPDGHHVATASGDGTARLMDASTGREIWRVEHGNEVAVNAVVFSPNGRYLAIASTDGTARVLEATTGKELSRLKHGGQVNAVAFSPDNQYLATASADRTARVMLVASGREAFRSVHQKTVHTVAFSPDGKLLASGSEDGIVRLMNTATGKEAWRYRDQGSILRVVFSPDSGRLAIGLSYRIQGHDSPEFGQALVLTTANGKPVFSASHGRLVAALAFSPDNRYIATGSLDNTARLFDLKTGIELWRIVHQGSVQAVAFSPDGQRVATGGVDTTARVIELKTGKEIARLPHEGYVNCLAFSPDGKRLATASGDGTARVMEVSARKPLLHLLDQTPIYTAAFSPDRRYVATCNKEGTVRVIEVATGKELGRFQHQTAVYALAFSPDGRYLATGGKDNGGSRLIDLRTLREIGSLPHPGEVYAVAFSSDGQHVIASGEDKSIRVTEVLTGKQVASIPQQAKIFALAVSPTGQIATGGDDNTVHLLEDFTGRERLPLIAHPDQVNVVSFSANGRHLVTASVNTVRVIDTATGKEISRPLYHGDWLRAATFSADNRLVAVGGEDGMVEVFEIQTGREISKLSYQVKVDTLMFSPDGRFLQVVAGDALYREPLRPQDLMEEACSRLSRNLTAEEWKKYAPGVTPGKTCPSLPGP